MQHPNGVGNANSVTDRWGNYCGSPNNNMELKKRLIEHGKTKDYQEI
jgi:hypothetical protein